MYLRCLMSQPAVGGHSVALHACVVTCVRGCMCACGSDVLGLASFWPITEFGRCRGLNERQGQVARCESVESEVEVRKGGGWVPYAVISHNSVVPL